MNVKGGDNKRVRSALLAFVNTYAGLHAYNSLSPFMQHVVLDMPETTITAEIIGADTPKGITHEVIAVIKKAGATPSKVYVAQVNDEYLWNA